jgi:hypothetical protein
VYEDAGASERPSWAQDAIEAVEAGEAQALVVSTLDKLSRSVVDSAGLVARAQKRGWALVAACASLSKTSRQLMRPNRLPIPPTKRRSFGNRRRQRLGTSSQYPGLDLDDPTRFSGLRFGRGGDAFGLGVLWRTLA